jgi:hypothetical protein
MNIDGMEIWFWIFCSWFFGFIMGVRLSNKDGTWAHQHEWIPSGSTFETKGLEQGVIGYFCKHCGKLKDKSYTYRNDLEAERDNYMANKKRVDQPMQTPRKD